VTTLGIAPPAVPVPTTDGYYWVRLAEPRYVHVEVPDPRRDPSRNYFTWDNPLIRVELVRLEEGMTDRMGSDEGHPLESGRHRLIEVIAKLEVPA
jgi:hypothetical protein